MAHHSNAKGIAWIALVVSIIALIFAWIAFNETGPNLDDRVESEVEQALETMQTTQPETNQPATTTEQPDPEPTPPTEERTTSPETEA
jgi:outer membrane biosynthesis protein TonB